MEPGSSSYFIITEPTRDTQWALGTPNPISWTKGVLDDIASFDVEMARLDSDGLTFVAQNVPAAHSSLNILLQDVPLGDDYFLLFMNSTHGVTYATSPRFSVVSGSSSKSTASVVSDVQTVTVNGAPNPTQQFAVTFPAMENRGFASWGDARQAWSLGSVLVGCVVGVVWTLR
ncbi:hypothetical protein E4T56_gene20016 [Termitomyces sp. T112]|nr:hypothetical protein E4T56_gene20016 [Termitomyces sp. T112]